MAFLQVALLLCAPARAQDVKGFTSQSTAAGVTPSVTYNGDLVANTRGGARRGETYLGSLQTGLALDFGKLADIPGLTAYVEGLWLQGGDATGLVGDAQGVSSIAGPPGPRLYEAWLQYNAPGSRFSMLAGLYDLNLEFYRVRSAALFLNSSFGIGPEFSESTSYGPSVFPITSPGVRFAFKPSIDTVIRTAILDAVPFDPPGPAVSPKNGILLVTEAALLTRPADTDLPGSSHAMIGRRSQLPPYEDKIAVGGWYYTSHFDDLSAVTASGAPVVRHGEAGGYVLLDRTLYKTDGGTVSGFLQLGVADQRVDRFGTFAGAGLTANGMIPSRPDDQFGIGVAAARNGRSYIRSQRDANHPVSGGETTLEVSYLGQVRPWLALQPDLQRVFSPDSDPRRRTATVAMLRVTMNF